MARRRKTDEIPPTEPSNDLTLGDAAQGLSTLFPYVSKRARCAICDRDEADIVAHIKQWHGKSVEDYERQYKPISKTATEESKEKRIRVSPEDVAEHPGGREGLLVEKELTDKVEKTLYREDLLDLAKRYNLPLPVGFQVVQLAYDMMQARRCRKDINDARNKVGGKVWDADTQDRLRNLNSSIQAGLRDLQKIKENAPPEGEKPEVLFEQERAAAEKFVRDRLGELDEVCPNPACGQPITLPALPHWAFAPMETATEKTWMVWSQELWWLFTNGQLRLWQMALVLRTSPEFLQITAQRRGLVWPEGLDLLEEERLLRKAMDERDREARTIAGFDQEVKVELIDKDGLTLALPAPADL